MSELLPTLLREARRAEALKDRGNACFARRELASAYELYSKALKLAPPLPRAWGALPPELGRLRVVLFSNRALVAFQLGWLLSCVADCSSSVAQNARGGKEQGFLDLPLLRKALLRRAAAWWALDVASRARADLQEALLHGSSRSGEEEALLREESSSRGPGLCLGKLPDEPLVRVACFLPLVALAQLRGLDHASLGLCRQPALWERQLRLAAGPLGAYEECWLDEAFVQDAALQAATRPPSSEYAAPAPWQRAPRNLLGPLGCFPPVVLDVGMGYTKIGLAGATLPSVLMCNHHIMGRSSEIVSFGLFTDDAEALRDFFREAVFGPLLVDPRRHPVVLCLSLFQHRRYPEQQYRDSVPVVEAALKALGVPHVCGLHSASLALLGHRQHTGVVVDIGLGATRATPVLQGVVQTEAVYLQTVGAANCTNYLLQVLREREDLHSITPPNEQLSGYQVMMLVKVTKEELGYVAASREEAERAAPLDAPALSAAFSRPMDLGRELATVGEMFFTPSYTGPQHSYFGPSAPQPRLGIHQLVQRAVSLCPAEHRASLAQAVVLAGGTCSLPGMQQRLQSELNALSKAVDGPLAGCSPRVLDVIPEACWHGGSVAGSELWRVQQIRRAPGGEDGGELGPYWSMCSERIGG